MSQAVSIINHPETGILSNAIVIFYQIEIVHSPSLKCSFVFFFVAPYSFLRDESLQISPDGLPGRSGC